MDYLKINEPQIKRNDNLVLGIILGIVSPLLGCFLYFLILWFYSHGSSSTTFGYFFKTILSGNKSSIVSVSVLANLPWFYWFLNREKYLVVRGIVLATIGYSIIVLVLFWIL